MNDDRTYLFSFYFTDPPRESVPPGGKSEAGGDNVSYCRGVAVLVRRRESKGCPPDPLEIVPGGKIPVFGGETISHCAGFWGRVGMDNSENTESL